MARYLGDWRRRFHRLSSVREFPQPGHEVLCMDNYSTGAKDKHSPAFARNPRFASSTITSAAYIEVHRARWTYVLHFASPASPVDYFELPIPTLKVGAFGHAQCAGSGQSQETRFLCWPRPPRSMAIRWCGRNTKTIGATSIRSGRAGVYDEAKRFAEAMTMAYHRYHRSQHAYRANLQYLRARACAMRDGASGAELHHAGAARASR